MNKITLRAETFPKEQLPDVLKRHDISINAYAQMYFDHPSFSTDHFPDEVHTVIASLRELGFDRGATLKDIFEILPQYRLKPCHVNTGLFLRIAWKDQKQSVNSILSGSHQAPDQAVTVLSDILERDDTFPKGLYLRNVEGTLWLRGYVCDASYQWSSDDLFAFEEDR